MGSVRQQRGRLPQRVYWVRRGVVLLVGLALVMGIGKLLGGTGSDDPGTGIEASTSSAHQKPDTSATIGPVAPPAKLHTRSEAPLLPPSGKCEDDEVSAVPSVPRAWAGGPIRIKVALSGTQPACTFDVSYKTLVVKIASGDDRIWSSQDCKRGVRRTQVVVRSGKPVTVPVIWSGRRSDEGCTNAPDWAMTGFYHVFAAATGSTGNDVQFEVTHAPTLRVTKTPKPRPSASAKARAKASASARPSKKPTSRVSGKESKCGGDNAASSC
jgi:hypothetical protein